MADEPSLHDRESLERLSKDELVKKVLQLQKEREDYKIRFSEGQRTEELTKEETNDSFVQIKKKSKKMKTQDRQFDFTRYKKRHIALMIAYLGWDMHGFAAQDNIDTTIEAYLFEALTKARLVEGREGANYSRCGRTDKGVSAFRQVVSLDVRSNLPGSLDAFQTRDNTVIDEQASNTEEVKELPYVRILNNLLPAEIRILSWAPVAPEFDARFSCTSRKYKYYFPAADLDLELMNKSAKKLEGGHDFRNFCKMDVANGVVQFKRIIISFEIKMVENPIDRVVTVDTYNCETQVDTEQNESRLMPGYNMCEAVICGSAFLWHQVRCMISILLMVGQGLEKPEVIDWLLDVDRCPQRPQYNMALEFPLVLYDCVYENVPWIYEPAILQSVTKHLQQLWTLHSVRATMTKELINLLGDVPVLVRNGGTDSNSAWYELKPQQCDQSSLLISGEACKSHKALMERAVCESFEQKLENVNLKRKKKGKELLVPEKATEKQK